MSRGASRPARGQGATWALSLGLVAGSAAGALPAWATDATKAAGAEPPAALRVGDTRSLLADLPAEVRAALPSDLDPPLAERSDDEQLQAVFEAVPPYEFDSGPLIVYADPRWFSTLLPAAPESFLLELRRWPGDSRIVFYAVAGPQRFVRGEGPPVEDGTFTVQEGASETYAEWRGTVHTEIGDVPAIWVEAPAVDGAATLLGALLLPGDAGLGESAVRDLTTELYALLGRVSIRPQLWGRKPGLPPGAKIPLGTTIAVPGAKDEQLDPWQVALGTDFSVGLPPGVQARRTDAGMPAPVTFEGSRMWLRGRFVDTSGAAVVIGDARRAGYVAEVPAPAEGWIEGKTAPLGAPTAVPISSAAFSVVKEPFLQLKQRSGATAVLAGRWREPGFDGEWLVFRIDLPERNVEIGLPMLAGRRSPSLFWIPASWRDAGQPPAEPPVDPAARFGIQWERLSRGERAKRPWVEGLLTVPGLRFEVPLGWLPASTLRSTAGFPVRFVGPEGRTLARLVRVEAREVAEWVGAPGAEGARAGPGWVADERPGMHRAEAEWHHADGRQLYVDAQGGGFLFEIAAPDAVEATTWQRLGESVQLVRSGG